MLTALNIQDFVLIDQLALPLESGLTALTGETGAGKSILLDALGLAIGARAERGAVREGAKQATVSATFEPGADHPIWGILESNALIAGEDQVILRRVQGVDGRSRAFVNDLPVSIGLLRQVGESLLEVHGQHDGRGFLSAAAHRDMLDHYGRFEKRTDEVASNWREWRDFERALEKRRSDRDETLREVDYLRHVVDELSKLDPLAEEESNLAVRRTELMAAEKITEDLVATVNLLGEGGLESKLMAAMRRLERAASVFEENQNPLSAALERLDAVMSEVLEARAALDDAVNHLGHNPQDLDDIEERLFAIRGAARKYAVLPEALPVFLEKARRTLSDLEFGEAAFSDLEHRVEKARTTYFACAKTLSAERRKAASSLDHAVAKELAPLKLGRSKFLTSITTDEDRPMSEGIDMIEFMVATNPGSAPGPLKTIASGGELSRFVLAMKAALAVKENRTVIIFDEIDAGVGGAVADAVGERLARLAQDAQVLVVTHSPQVAARADKQWRIEKTQKKTSTRTTVTQLAPEDRIEEIARMLSGAKITDEARAAARQLLGVPESASSSEHQTILSSA